MHRISRWCALVSLVPVLLCGCSSPEQPPPRPAVSSSLADGGGTPAKRRPVTDADTEVREITAAGRSRSYRLHSSARPAEGAGRPLLLVLHGKGGSAERMERYSGLNEAADAVGVAVAYLEGLSAGWSASPRPTALRPNPAADVDFAHAVIEELSHTADIDPEHVYVAGFSEGGAMALRLAAERPDWFAAAASVAGQLAGSA
ncbi:CE1 family esterase, partial [Amycolatopsis cihanbeyliensis]